MVNTEPIKGFRDYTGDEALKRAKIREIAGKTNPEEADPLSIRGKYGRVN